MLLFEELREELASYLPDDHIENIQRAYFVAEKAHRGQKRRSGEPYIIHPVAAAKILAHMRMDPQTIMAALLHDVLEDTKIDRATLAEQFGEEVAALVDGVSKLTQIEFEDRIQQQAENFRKMILAMVRDIRVILVKLADRLHNMRTLDALDAPKRRRIARETLEIYAPIANRLGMHTLFLELEDLGFAALHPKRYLILKAAVKKARGNRKEIMSTIEATIKRALEDHRLSVSAVSGREKHIYSIYKKMEQKQISFADIMDIFGFRIVTDSVDTCYRVLGVVHGLYKPLPERFKDYIAMPKANGYQSLHTTLFGPYGVPIEIQIRTADMDNMAEFGIAAHWLYKTDEAKINPAQVRARQWLKGLLEIQQSAGSSLEFIENVKIDLFPDEIYVFTPKGRILALPQGATPVDFAYDIHSDIGDSCVAAKIDRRLVPLSTKLTNGQTIEIITAPSARPSASWLNFVVTGKARGKIRHFLKNQRRAESVAFGEQLLQSALHVFGFSLEKIPYEIMNRLLEFYQVKTMDDLAELIGLGNVLPQAVTRYLADLLNKKPEEMKTSIPLTTVAIRGTEGMVVNFAPCCCPIPGDPILGIITPGQGLVVHLDDCTQIIKERYQTDACIPVQWDNNVQGEYKVDVVLEAANERGVLAQLTTTISDEHANIDNIRTIENHRDHYVELILTLSVHDRVHLARVMRRIRSIKAINHISRRKEIL